jgi:single-stranded DNA-binding protein
MAGSVNKVIVVGNLGADPEVRDLPSGQKVANLRVATQGNRASEAFDECSQEVIAPSCLFELHAV